MFLKTFDGAYINSSFVEQLSVNEHEEDPGFWVTAFTIAGVNEGQPYSVYRLYGPKKNMEEAQEVLDALVRAIHEAMPVKPNIQIPKMERV